MKIKANIGPGRTALITGGSTGIGYSVAKELIKRGCNVWLVARRNDVLEQAIKTLRQSVTSPGQTVQGISADVSIWEKMESVAEDFYKTNQSLDILVNSAGVVHPGYVQDLTIEHFHWMMDINFHGTVHTIKAFLPEMMARRTGYIINISSGGGLVGVFGYTAYSASKFAVRGFTEALRWELEPYQIGVASVYPPDTETPQLVYDIQHKPPETAALTQSAGRMTAEAVASEIVKGALRWATVILPGNEAKLLYLLSTNLGGKVVEWASRIILRRVAHQRKSRQITK
jgi:3-dehydrosphinganine reductase